MALLDGTKLIHGTVPKSVKFYLNPSSGLFEPIFFNGHKDQRIKNFRLSDFMSPSQMDNSNCGWLCEDWNRANWYKIMFGSKGNFNPIFYSEYFKTLEKLSSKIGRAHV